MVKKPDTTEYSQKNIKRALQFCDLQKQNRIHKKRRYRLDIDTPRSENHRISAAMCPAFLELHLPAPPGVQCCKEVILFRDLFTEMYYGPKELKPYSEGFQEFSTLDLKFSERKRPIIFTVGDCLQKSKSASALKCHPSILTKYYKSNNATLRLQQNGVLLPEPATKARATKLRVELMTRQLGNHAIKL